MWNTIKQTNIHVVRVPEREQREGVERLFEEIIVENFSKLVKDMNTNIQKGQQIASRINSRKPTLKHIIIKLLKDRNLKAAREK